MTRDRTNYVGWGDGSSEARVLDHGVRPPRHRAMNQTMLPAGRRRQVHTTNSPYSTSRVMLLTIR